MKCGHSHNIREEVARFMSVMLSRASVSPSAQSQQVNSEMLDPREPFHLVGCRKAHARCKKTPALTSTGGRRTLGLHLTRTSCWQATFSMWKNFHCLQLPAFFGQNAFHIASFTLYPYVGKPDIIGTQKC